MSDRAEPPLIQDPDEITWITAGVAITNFYSAHQSEFPSRPTLRAPVQMDFK